MPWFKVDDKFHSHPKVMELSLPAVGLWTLAGSWCADYLTDGEIRRGQLRRLGASDQEAAELVEAGLWEETEGGYRFCDWHDYQPTREAVRKEQEAAAERQRRRREQQLKGKKSSSSPVTEESRRDTSETHGHVTEKFAAPEPEPEPEVPTGTSTTPPEGRGRKKPTAPIPDDWTPSDAHKTRATELGVDAALEAEKFFNHAKANDRRQADWSRSFYTWLANARTFQDRSPAGGQQFRSSAEKRVDAGRAWLSRSEGWDDARAAADNPFELEHPNEPRRITG